MISPRKAVVSCVAATILLLLAGWIQLSRPFWRISKLRDAYSTISKGEAAASVILKMGEEGLSPNAEAAPYWDDEKLSDEEEERIVRSLSYAVPTFYLGVTFAFSFDADDRLIGKHIYD